VRFAANLLFQYRVVPKTRKRTVCESQVVALRARSANAAIRRAAEIGRRKQHSYRNAIGGTCHIEFLGLIDLIELVDQDESWYRIFSSAAPKRLVTPTKRLSVLRGRDGTIGAAIWAVPASESGVKKRRRRS